MTPANKTDPLSQIIEAAVEMTLRRLIETGITINRPRLVSVAQAGADLALSPSEIHNMVASGELQCVRHGRRMMVLVASLDSWLDKKKGETL